MSSVISQSVGRWERAAKNLSVDVKKVQRLLKASAKALGAPELDPKGIDGKIARPPARSNTVAAIESFQRRFTSSVDGLILPDSQTWDALVKAAGKEATLEDEVTVPDDSSSARVCVFPFRTIPAKSWTERPRAFASPRAGGNRLHAGCDLYFPRGTSIHAITAGIVARGPYYFYAGTYALEIDHGAFLARYGEIQGETEVRAGARVRAGQIIARVGHLVGIQVPSDMLHLELYDKSRSGPLTIGSGSGSAERHGVPFMRRKDLIDPTTRLNEWRNNLPKA